MRDRRLSFAGRAPELERDAEALGAVLPPLLVAAERVANTVSQGVHGRRRVGQGDAFWQFRRYEPGDPIGRIDWRKSAKSDPVFIRETEWAAAQSVWLWIDQSPSMRWRSQAAWPEKQERAALLLLALASLLIRAGERIALIGEHRLPSSGRAVLARLALSLGLTATRESPPGLPDAVVLPRHAQVVLLGDFLAPLEEIDRSLRRLAEMGVGGHVVQVLDPAEESLPFGGRVRFSGLEGEGDTLITRAEDVRDAYIERLRHHREGLAALCRSLGWGFAVHHTDQPPQAALLALYAALARPRD